MWERCRWLGIPVAGVVAGLLVLARAQFPRATIALDAGSPYEYMIRDPREVSYLPDGKRIVTFDWTADPEGGDPQQNHLRLWDARTGRLVARLVEGPAGKVLAVSADSSLIAVDESEGYVAVVESATGQTRWSAWTGDREGFAFVWHELGYLDGEAHEIREVRSARLLPSWDCEVWHAREEAQQTRKHKLRRDSPFYLVNPAKGAVAAYVPYGDVADRRLTWMLSANGRFLSLRGSSNDAEPYISTYEIRDLMSGDIKRHEFSHFKRWGNALDSLACDGENVALHVDSEGLSPFRQRLVEWCVPVRNAEWAVAVYHVPTGRRTFYRNCALYAVFSPDGRTLAVLGDDNVVELWDYPIGVQTWPTVLAGLLAATPLAAWPLVRRVLLRNDPSAT